MPRLRTQKRWALAASEGANYGQDASPIATNAIECISMELTPLAGNTVRRDTIRGYFGGSGTLVATEQSNAQFVVELAGSGTPGVPPAYSPFLTSCGLAETITPAAVTGAAQAGGSNTITLAATASAVDDYYVSMPITFTAGLGNGAVGIITSYDGTTKVAEFVPFDSVAVVCDSTTEYSIPANVLYTPITDVSGVADTSCTIYYFVDRVLHRMFGARGTMSINCPLNDRPTITFDMTSLYSTPIDQAVPAPVYGNQAVPQIFRNGNAGGYSFLGDRRCLESFSMALNNSIEYIARIGCQREVDILGRDVGGNVVIEAPLIAENDYFSAALDDTLTGSGLLSLLHGTAPGQRVGIVNPYCDMGQPVYQDGNGVHMLNLPYNAIPVAPGNNETRICFA